MRKIIICIDGTGNEIGDRETNILKLYKALRKDDSQIVHYEMGIGTYAGPQFLGPIRRFITAAAGQTFGYGLEDDVLAAYATLCRAYRSKERKQADDPGLSGDAAESDHIYIAGFSRGAYAARMLAGFVHNFGLVPPDRLHLITPVFRAYRSVTDFELSAPDQKVFQSLREYERALEPEPASIRALLLFDTVGSMIRFRRPWFNIRHFYSLAEMGTHASVNSNVSARIVLHALAMHDRRSLFRAMRWQPECDDEGQPVYYGNNFRNPKAKRRQYVRQRWFPGYHSDIGGSPPENEAGIGKITLLWMLEALAEAERAADAEDNAQRKSARHAALPGPRSYGLKLKQGARQRYFEGAVADARTPGGLPYSAPDPAAPIHNSHTTGALGPLWCAMEFFPKSVKRREPGPPAWFRRAWLFGLWYLPLFEPRHIPPDDETDPSASAHPR